MLLRHDRLADVDAIIHSDGVLPRIDTAHPSV